MKKYETAELTGAETLGEEEASKLTKREYFAGLAMQGLCSGAVGFIGEDLTPYAKGPHNAGIAKRAVALADALLAELAKGE